MQNDVIAIADEDGNIAVNYTYDAWGNILSTTGSMASTVGGVNPIRYRSYYYDGETGFYYLQSRYYDPMIRRFINADGVISGVGGEILGYNQYAYCFNNPVNYVDYTGEFPWLIVISFAAGFIVGVVCESLKQAHYSRNQYQDNNITNNPNEIIGSEDWEAQPPEANMYHMHTAGEQGQDAKDNVKYMSDNGKYEVVINFTDKDNPKIVTDPYNKGTYNFADYREYPLEHIVIDVIPYYLWGNSKEDSNPFFMIHRIFGNLGG